MTEAIPEEVHLFTRREALLAAVGIAGGALLAGNLSGCSDTHDPYRTGSRHSATPSPESPAPEAIPPLEADKVPFRRMLCSSYTNGFIDVTLASPDGLYRKDVAKSLPGGSLPLWSPRGDTFAMAVAGRSTGDKGALRLFDSNGTLIHAADTGDLWPTEISWLPDGQSLLYQASGWNAVGRFDVKSGTAKEFMQQTAESTTTVDNSLSVSPDGSRFVVAHHEWGSQYYARMYDTRDLRAAGFLQLASGNLPGHDAPIDFHWSQDGKRLFINAEKYVDLSGLDPSKKGFSVDCLQATLIPWENPGERNNPGKGQWYGRPGSISNDGNKIARPLSVYDDKIRPSSQKFIEMSGVKGEDVIRVRMPNDPDIRSIVWLPGDKQIAAVCVFPYQTTSQGQIRNWLFVCNADGSDLRGRCLPDYIASQRDIYMSPQPLTA
ncbi:MAG TPA: hypothetical protein VMR45_01275 [Patescibacteria group bacterium]|nr:hypothetical protein [Patescibacteria group bacterium]